MWEAIVNITIWIFGLFGVGKPDPVKQGEALGKAETEAAASEGELRDIATANSARNSVSDDPSGVWDDPLNSGPSKPV